MDKVHSIRIVEELADGTRKTCVAYDTDARRRELRNSRLGDFGLGVVYDDPDRNLQWVMDGGAYSRRLRDLWDSRVLSATLHRLAAPGPGQEAGAVIDSLRIDGTLWQAAVRNEVEGWGLLLAIRESDATAQEVSDYLARRVASYIDLRSGRERRDETRKVVLRKIIISTCDIVPDAALGHVEGDVERRIEVSLSGGSRALADILRDHPGLLDGTTEVTVVLDGITYPGGSGWFDQEAVLIVAETVAPVPAAPTPGRP